VERNHFFDSVRPSAATADISQAQTACPFIWGHAVIAYGLRLRAGLMNHILFANCWYAPMRFTPAHDPTLPNTLIPSTVSLHESAIEV
jgi:hypothetical protein